MHEICSAKSLLHASTCFEHHVLMIFFLLRYLLLSLSLYLKAYPQYEVYLLELKYFSVVLVLSVTCLPSINIFVASIIPLTRSLAFITRSKLYYTVSGIITPVGGCPVHGMATYRCDDTRGCIIQF